MIGPNCPSMTNKVPNMGKRGHTKIKIASFKAKYSYFGRKGCFWKIFVTKEDCMHISRKYAKAMPKNKTK